MKTHSHALHFAAAATFALLSSSAFAQQSGLPVPARTLPVPTIDVSPEIQKVIALPLRKDWDLLPKTGEEWKPIVEAAAAGVIKNVIPGLVERMKVKVEPTTIDGVKAFIITPEKIAAGNENRTIIHMHGGCYVLSPGEAGLPEGLMMAGFGGFKVISVDYRMPPTAYFPAALDDGITVYKNLLKTVNPTQRRVHRHVRRRRAGARNGVAREATQPADAGRNRIGHADVGRDESGRHVLHQRAGRQRAGLARRLLRCRREGVRQWP